MSTHPPSPAAPANAPAPAPAPAVAPIADIEHDALPMGTRFAEFEILKVVGFGGFGIVYLAQDHSLQRQVALKEYMPASLATRGAGSQITIRSAALAETYAIGLRSFVNEARLLARFDHASLVKVYRFWEDNGTAYMVMPFLRGMTLRDARRAMTHPPDETWIRRVIEPLLGALELLHREGVYHRDVAPDNVLLQPEGTPILLDFGAARHVISGRTQSLTAILKPAYAPIEQYAEMTSMRQGAWTDIYALGAVMHYLLFGVPPEPSTARALQPDAEPINQRSVYGVSPRFISIVAWALAVRPADRPQSIAELREALNGNGPIPGSPQSDVTLPGDPMVVGAGFEPKTSFLPTEVAAPAYSAPARFAAVPPQSAAPVSAQVSAPATAAAPPTPPTQTKTQAPATSKAVWWVGGLALAGCVGAVGLWKFLGLSETRAPSVAQTPAVAASAAASADAPAPPIVIVPSVVVEAASVLPPAAAASTAAAPQVAPPVRVGTPVPAATSPSPATKPPIPTVAATVQPSRPVPSAATEPQRARPVATRPVPAVVEEPTEPAVKQDPYAIEEAEARLRAERAKRDAAAAAIAAGRPPPSFGANPSRSATEVCSQAGAGAQAACMARECERPTFRAQSDCTKLGEVKRSHEGQ